MTKQRYRTDTDRRKKYESEIDSIKHLLRDVRDVQTDDAYRLMERSDHVYTRSDVEWIVDQLGYRPTRQMWEEAGIKSINNSFIGQGPDWLY